MNEKKYIKKIFYNEIKKIYMYMNYFFSEDIYKFPRAGKFIFK